jgi:hypothetical protein
MIVDMKEVRLRERQDDLDNDRPAIAAQKRL